MSEVDVRKVGLGVALLGVSTALIFGPDTVGSALPAVLVALGTFGAAVGALVADAGEDGRPV